jgi:cholesterol transport system auxiliary component
MKIIARVGWLTLALYVSSGVGGCALTSKADALSVRWFNPEPLNARLTSTAPDSRPHANGTTLELGRVTSGAHLREKIAYRDAAFEVGYYDDSRWTERPEVYVRRAVARTLFEQHGVRRALAGQAPVLDIEVMSFEEIRGKARGARIQLRMMVHDEAHSLLEKTITVERPVEQDGIAALVQAMAEALSAAAEEVARESEAAAATVPTTTITR